MLAVHDKAPVLINIGKPIPDVRVGPDPLDILVGKEAGVIGHAIGLLVPIGDPVAIAIGGEGKGIGAVDQYHSRAAAIQ